MHGIQFITEIADLQDAEKMTMVMSNYQPDVVYHAAAHKHVPLMERNPEEAVKEQYHRYNECCKSSKLE